MDEEVKPVQEPEQKPAVITAPPKAAKKHFKLKPILLGLLVLILMAASATGSYFWRDSVASNFEKQQTTDIDGYKATITSLQGQLADAQTNNTDETDDETVCTEVAPVAAAIDNIKASITSANTAALEGYMATSVNVILAASEAYGPQTPTQAISDISNFLSDDLDSWDYNFALSAATIDSYQTGDYSQYFPDTAVVGKATNNQVISFSFDCNGKIDTVFLATNASLL